MVMDRDREEINNQIENPLNFRGFLLTARQQK